MFRENIEHLQRDLFGLFQSMPPKLQEKAAKSEERMFYEQLLCNIDEHLFSVLYSNEPSRPNKAVNAMVAALVLRHRRFWTYGELFKNIQFNLLTRLALGLDDLESMPFCPATLFNFQKLLTAHFLDTGVDLLEQVFDNLTTQQLETLGIKTDIQRTDSFMVESNICTYTRVRLLVEVLLRFYRTLSDEDKKECGDYFSAYLKEHSSNSYVYKLEDEDLPRELETLAELYHFVVKKFKSRYKDTKIYQTLKRTYQENFTVAHKKVHVKPDTELTSDCLQSPDDEEATYLRKNGKHHHGRSINIVETANPDNEVNLITDVDVNPNNVHDSAALNKRYDRLKDKTPDLNEMHTDGAYGSSDNDVKCAELKITQIQTAVCGRQTEVRFDIEQVNDHYIVTCPKQQKRSEPTRARHKACFDLAICATCEHRNGCPARLATRHRIFYFNHDDYLRYQRINMIYMIPKERRKIRPNVEASVREFKRRTDNGKLRVRGTFRTRIFAFSTAIAINFGRMFRYQRAKPAAQTA